MSTQPRYSWQLSQTDKLQSLTSDVHGSLQSSLDDVRKIIANMESDTTWAGEHKVMFLAWMDLLQQIHTKLAQDGVGGTAATALGTFNNALSGFESTSTAMTNLWAI